MVACCDWSKVEVVRCCVCVVLLQAKRDDVAYTKWKQYKKSKDYQIKCQVWGQLGGC